MRFFPVVLLVCAAFALSDTATQTDWSGGEGYPGPVTDWGDCYDVQYQIDDGGSSMQLKPVILSGNPLQSITYPFAGASSVYAADVDGDGDIDVLGTADEDNTIGWWENTDGTGTSWTEHILNDSLASAGSVCAVDFDEDGDIDVIGGSSALGGLYLWENTDGTGTAWTQDRVDVNTSFDHISTVSCADMDGDGDNDVVAASFYSYGIEWFCQMSGTWGGISVSGSDNTISMDVADVDGDGDMDLLGARSYYIAYQDEISWWENTDGTGTSWTERTVSANFEGAVSVYASDVDGDGDIDILGAAEDHNEITWWENCDGAGTTWTEHIIDGDFFQARGVCAADVDDDGDTDVLGISSVPVGGGSNGVMNLWLNTDGTGTQWSKHCVDSWFMEGTSLFTADVNGNGHTDVLGARTAFNGSLLWYELMGYPLYGTLESSILDADTVVSWDTVTFSSDEPAGTSVSFQFRSSNDSANMGAWSDTVYASGTSLSGILVDSTDFLQYKAILHSSDISSTPVLNDITLNYSIYVSIDENTADAVTGWGLAPAANPSFGNIAVQVSVPQTEMVSLVLHDVTGRVITQHSQVLPSGTHSVSFSNMAEGVYFCTMQGGDFTATQRVVVLK